jgi:hypothetical protein
MNYSILLSFITSAIYFVIKIITEKIIMKEELNLKRLFSDSISVFISSFLAFFISEQFKLVNMLESAKSSVFAFTNTPDF